MKSVRRLLLAFWCSLVLALTPVAFAQSDTSAEGVAEATKAVQAEVQAEANIQTEELAKKSDRSEDEDQRLADHLAAVRDQLEMAQLLGYGRKDDYEQLYAQLDQIKARTGDGESGEGFFEKLEKTMASLID